MKFIETSIPGVFVIEPSRIGDHRGFFSETFRDDLFRRHVGEFAFVQDNFSLSAAKGTLRGLHFQKPPRAQGKLVRVGRGAILDVAVDIRHGSPTYGRHVAVELSAENWRQLWAPPGMLHGFCTLTPDAEVLYKVTDGYSAEHDAAVQFDDPDIGIPWPVGRAEAVISDKDMNARPLREMPACFSFQA